MRIKNRTIAAIICVAALLASIVGAQEKRQNFVYNGGGGQVFNGGAGGFTFGGQGDNTFVYLSTEMSLSEKMVKGAPYSAQAVTEQVQVLGDGNRIVRRSTSNLYRDSEGRTRREQSLNAVGPYAASGEPQQMIFINDPVAQVNYILDSKTRTARKMDLGGAVELKKRMSEDAKAGSESKAAAVDIQRTVEKKAEAAAVAGGGARVEWKTAEPALTFERSPFFESSVASVIMKGDLKDKNAKKEDLGKQMIEGVEAQGNRVTITIPAGEIGNENPIYIVSETWFSPELQTVVMTKHSDPRMGENTYRLTNINRSEPAHSLFELPSDYSIKETVKPPMRYKIESEIRRPEKQSNQ